MAETKKLWVLLRGLGREKAHWRGFPEQLKSSLKDVEVLAVDLPGCGDFFEVATPTNVAEITHFVRAEMLRQLKSHPSYEKKYVLAISLGGMVAIDWISRFTGDFSAAVLINTSIGKINLPFQRVNLRAFLQGVASLPKGMDEREKTFLSLVCNDEKTRQESAADWLEIQRQRPVKNSTILTQLWAASRFKTVRSTPPLPILILNSLGDRVVNPNCGKKLASFWQSKLETHPSAGHDLPLDDGAWVAEKIENFLNSI